MKILSLKLIDKLFLVDIVEIHYTHKYMLSCLY